MSENATWAISGCAADQSPDCQCSPMMRSAFCRKMDGIDVSTAAMMMQAMMVTVALG